MNKQNKEKYNDNINREGHNERRFDRSQNPHHEDRYRPEIGYGKRYERHVRHNVRGVYGDGRFNREMKYRTGPGRHFGRMERGAYGDGRFNREMKYRTKPGRHFGRMERGAYGDGRFNREMKYRTGPGRHFGRMERGAYGDGRFNREMKYRTKPGRHFGRMGRDAYGDGRFNWEMKYRTGPEYRFGRRHPSTAGYLRERQTSGNYRKPVHQHQNKSSHSLMMKKVDLERRMFHLKKRLRSIEHTLRKRYDHQKTFGDSRSRSKSWAY